MIEFDTAAVLVTQVIDDLPRVVYHRRDNCTLDPVVTDVEIGDLPAGDLLISSRLNHMFVVAYGDLTIAVSQVKNQVHLLSVTQSQQYLVGFLHALHLITS